MFNTSRSADARPAWVWPVVASALLVVGGASWLIIPEQRAQRHLTGCHDNLRQVVLAIRQYALDNDERYPLVQVAKVNDGKQPWGWADAIAPYTDGPRMFQCPREATAAGTDPSKNGFSDYWYNGRLAKVPEGQIDHIKTTVALGEGGDSADTTSARYHKTAIPKTWLTDTDKPAFRHSGGANYAFVDGHVKWCVPEEVASPAPDYAVFSLGIHGVRRPPNPYRGKN